MNRNSGNLRSVCALLVALVGVLTVADVSSAALLGLTLGHPDMTIGKVNIVYDASANTFVATGTVSMLDMPGGLDPDYSSAAGTVTGTFEIKAMINNGGVILSPTSTHLNRMVVTGTATGLGINSSQVLLQADLVQVGANSTTIEFRFNNATGALANSFKAPLGVILSTGNPSKLFPSDFDTAYNNITSKGKFPGTADIASEVPEPASLVVWSLTATSLLALRGYRSRRRTLTNVVW